MDMEGELHEKVVLVLSYLRNLHYSWRFSALFSSSPRVTQKENLNLGGNSNNKIS